MAVKTAQRSDLRLISLAFFGFICLGLADVALGVAWPSIRDNFGMGNENQFVLLLAATVGFILSSFNSGPLAARYGSGKLLLAGSICVGVGVVVMGLASSWAMLLAGNMLRALGAGALDAGTNAFAASRYNARVMNWLHASWGIGATISPLVMTTFIERGGEGWRWGYLSIALVYVVLISLFVLTLGEWRSRAPVIEDRAERAAAHSSLGSTLRLPIVWIMIIMLFSYVGIELTAGNWSFTLFTEARRVNTDFAGGLVSLYWGSFTVARIFFGMFAHRLTPASLMRVAMFSVALGALCFWLNPLPFVGYAGLIIMGVGLAPIFPLVILELPGRVGTSNAGNAVGFMLTAAGLGGAVMPGLVGNLSEHFSLEVIGPVLVFFIIIAIGMNELSLVIARRNAARAG